MVIVYIIIVCVVWILLKSTTDYKTLLFCRRFLDVSFYVFCIWGSIILLLSYIDSALVVRSTGNPEESARSWGIVIGVYCMIPLFYRIWKGMYRIEFYNSSHIKYLEKFILYLRSFKDDKKKTLTEYILMDFLSKNVYVPFAVGRPNEMKPSSHTVPLYIGDDWKNKVDEMMQKASIILMRVSDTEHFLWELGNCITQKHIHKSLFWITDPQTYIFFKCHCFEKYGLLFPKIEKVNKNCVVFFDGQEFQVCHLTNKNSYRSLYYKIHDVFNLKDDDYFYKRMKYKRLFLRFHYDDNVSAGVQRWDWVAFLFPEFYLMFHRFGWTRLLVLLLLEGYLMAGCLVFLCLQLNLSLYSMKDEILILAVGAAFRLPFMLLCGKNARTMEWYEEKWEGVSYFNDISHANNIKTLAYALGFLVLCLLGRYF